MHVLQPPLATLSLAVPAGSWPLLVSTRPLPSALTLTGPHTRMGALGWVLRTDARRHGDVHTHDHARAHTHTHEPHPVKPSTAATKPLPLPSPRPLLLPRSGLGAGGWWLWMTEKASYDLVQTADRATFIGAAFASRQIDPCDAGRTGVWSPRLRALNGVSPNPRL